MSGEKRLSADERRCSIVEAAKKVFADLGFEGTKTRVLAEAAGVSEALLYKHFPSKESLFEAMRDDCINGPMLAEFQKILDLPASTSTLVLMVHFLGRKMVAAPPDHGGFDRVKNTLVIRSMLENGDFARVMHKQFEKLWMPKFAECLKAALDAGEAVEGGVRPAAAGWFAHDLFAMIMLQRLPASPAVDYKLPVDELVAEATWFALRGLGLKQKAIERHYNPKALALLAG